LKKKIKQLIFLFFATIIIISCGPQKPVLVQDMVDDSIVDNIELFDDLRDITITVAVTDLSYYNDPIYDFAETFTKKHQSITFEFVRVENYYTNISYRVPYDSEQNAGCYETTIYNMLMSGNPPDMFIAPKWYLPFSNHVHGYLQDIYELMNSDKAFVKEEYFMNVIDAYVVNGKLYEFPLSFIHNYIAINNHMPASLIDEFKQMKTVDWFWLKNAHDRYGLRAGTDMNVYQNFFLLDALMYTVPSFFDYIHCEGWLDDAAANELFVKSFHELEPTEYWTNLSNSTPSDEKKLQEKYMFAKLPYDAWQYFYPIAEGGKGHGYINPLPYTDEKGELVVFNNTDSVNFCISADSMYKEVVWEFIKHMTLPETNGYGETYRNIPGMPPAILGSPIYKPTYMAVHDSSMPRRMAMLASKIYGIDYFDDADCQRLYTADLIEKISQLPVFVLPNAASFLGGADKMIFELKNEALNGKIIDSFYWLYAEIASMYGKMRILPMWPFPDGYEFDFDEWILVQIADE